jgi:hypothetical protein
MVWVTSPASIYVAYDDRDAGARNCAPARRFT